MDNLAKKYAQIIFKDANLKEQLKQLQEELTYFCSCLEMLPLFNNVLSSPIIDKTSKQLFLSKVIGASDTKLSNLFINFIKLLIQNGHFLLLKDIRKIYNGLSLEFQQITPVTITLAESATKERLESIKKLLKDKFDINGEIAINIDSTLLAGFKAEFNGYLYDASLKNIVDKLAKNKV